MNWQNHFHLICLNCFVVVPQSTAAVAVLLNWTATKKTRFCCAAIKIKNCFHCISLFEHKFEFESSFSARFVFNCIAKAFEATTSMPSIGQRPTRDRMKNTLIRLKSCGSCATIETKPKSIMRFDLFRLSFWTNEHDDSSDQVDSLSRHEENLINCNKIKWRKRRRERTYDEMFRWFIMNRNHKTRRRETK